MLACCAFAVFLLQQLLAPFAWMARRLWGKPGARPNDVVAWRPGMGVTPTLPRRFRCRPALALVFAFEALVIGGSVAAATLAARGHAPPSEQQFLNALHASICRAMGRSPS